MQTSKDSTETVRPERRRPFLVLKERDFRLMWFGQGISQLGTQMRRTAIGWQVYQLSHDPLQLGLLGLCQVGPMIVCSLLGGALADATDRRKLLLWAELMQIGCSLGLAVVTLSGIVSVGWIFVITILSASVSAIEQPTFSALQPSLVPRDQLPNAISLNTVKGLTLMAAGPGVGGLVIAVGGVQTVYWLDALSYLAVEVALLSIHYRPLSRPTSRVSLNAAFDGLRFIFGNKTLVTIMALDLLVTFFGWGTTLLPVFATEVLHTNEVGFGLLSAAQAVGAMAVSLVMAWAHITSIQRPGRILLVAVLFFSLFTILFGLSTWLPFSLLCLALVGASDTVSMVLRQTIFQLSTPDEMRGRMQSVYLLVFGGGPQLGEIEAGLVARWAGAPFSIVSGGIACLGVLLVIGLVGQRLRNYEFGLETKN